MFIFTLRLAAYEWWEAEWCDRQRVRRLGVVSEDDSGCCSICLDPLLAPGDDDAAAGGGGDGTAVGAAVGHHRFASVESAAAELPCGHSFHPRCLQVQSRSSWPTC